MSEVNAKLAGLRALRDELNHVSDQFNETIESIEDQLQGLGVTAWLDAPRHWLEQRDPASGKTTATLLGYTKLGDAWRLAVKPIINTRGFFEGDENCPWSETHDAGDPSALLKAPRAVRAEAAEHLEALLDALGQKATSIIAGVRNAQSLVTPKRPVPPLPTAAELEIATHGDTAAAKTDFLNAVMTPQTVFTTPEANVAAAQHAARRTIGTGAQRLTGSQPRVVLRASAPKRGK